MITAANFENFKISPDFPINFRKSHQISKNYLKSSESYGQKPLGGVPKDPPGLNRVNPKQAGGGGGGIRPQAGSSLCCAETVSSRKLKLCDLYYILISFHFEYNQSHGTFTVAMAMLLLKTAW